MIIKRFAILALAGAFAACGGGDSADAPANSTPGAAAPAEPAAPALGEMTRPEWFAVDEAAQTVTMTVTAGLTNAKNYWNFNGATDGNMTITVPVGYTVTIELVNDDPNMAHSLGVSAMPDGRPAAMPAPTPVFEGAITSNPTSMVESTMPGERETITFTATTAGEYGMICYVPGHAATGMWVHFNVSNDGSAGVQTAM